jgi:hypothetical protein
VAGEGTTLCTMISRLTAGGEDDEKPAEWYSVGAVEGLCESLCDGARNMSPERSFVAYTSESGH